MIGVSVPEEAFIGIPQPELGNRELVQCFRHEDEQCPRCDGSGYRPRKRCASCGTPSGRPGEGGKVLMGLRNRRGWNQHFYCFACHPELGREPTMLEKG